MYKEAWNPVHDGEAVFGMPVFAVFPGAEIHPFCVKTLFLWFQTAPVTLKLETAEAIMNT